MQRRTGRWNRRSRRRWAASSWRRGGRCASARISFWPTSAARPSSPGRWPSRPPPPLRPGWSSPGRQRWRVSPGRRVQRPSSTACRAGTTPSASALTRCWASAPASGGASSCPATSRCCGGRASRPWCATSTRKKKQNGSSSVWAGAPGAQSLCWGVPSCSEAVTLTPCAPCPRARAAA